MRGNQRGESKLTSNHFFTCTPQSGLLRDVHGVTQRREEGGRRQVARTIKGEIKRRETDPASNEFLKCSPPSGTRKEIHRVEQRREGEGGDRGDLGEKKESQ